LANEQNSTLDSELADSQATAEGVRVMPLDKSKTKAAFKQNVKTEVASGRTIKQALAIAYSVKRGGKKK